MNSHDTHPHLNISNSERQRRMSPTRVHWEGPSQTTDKHEEDVEQRFEEKAGRVGGRRKKGKRKKDGEKKIIVVSSKEVNESI
jgi:hypothetical protein